MEKDWKGNSVAYSKVLGASSHSSTEREQHDFYATEPKAVRMLLELENFEGKIWECACGLGHLSEEMKRLGYDVYSTDIVNRGYEDDVIDFLSIEDCEQTDMNIVTNPPYRYTDDWIVKSMNILQNGKKLALFLPIRYLEGKARKQIYKQFPPKTIYISSSRIKCAMNGNFDDMKGSAVSYAWFVWEKGHTKETILKWFN